MICPDCKTEREAFPCPCGYQIPSTTPIAPTLSIPIRSTYLKQAEGITKEEFGLNLYATIETIGGLLGLEQQRAAAIHYGHGFKIKGLLDRRDALRKILATQLPRVNDGEMAQVLERYPWVVTQ